MAENKIMKEEILGISSDNSISPGVKRIRIASIIADELAKCNVKAVMVGGSAVEFYTSQQYATQDIDFVLNTHESVTECMNALGFFYHGGAWECDGTPFIVEFPKGPLVGDINRVTNVKVDDRILVVIGLEDIIIDWSLHGRVGETAPKDNGKRFRIGFFNEWAKFMIEAHSNVLDWDYLIQRAREKDCEDVIRHFHRKYEKEIRNLDERNLGRKDMLGSEEYKKYIDDILMTDVTEVTSDSSDYDIFVYFAKPILSLAIFWSHEDDILLIKELCAERFAKDKLLRILTYSPNFFGLSAKEKSLRAEDVWKEAYNLDS